MNEGIVKQVRLIASSLVLILVAAVPGNASRVPETAYSRSMSMRPELLDHVSLVFAFPQRAIDSGGEFFATSGLGGYYESSSHTGVGLIGRSGPNAFFLGFQDASEDYYGGSVLFHGAWAFGWRSMQFGLAIRGTRKNQDRLETSEYYEAELERLLTRSDRDKSIEGAVGIGFRKDRFRWDLAVEIQDQEKDYFYFRRDSNDTLETDYIDKGDPSVGLKTQLEIDLGEKRMLTIAGGWFNPDREIDGFVRIDSVVQPYHEETDLEHWYGGIGLGIPTDIIDIFRIYSFIRVDEYREVRGDYRSIRLKQKRRENVWLGASMEHEILDKLVMRAGIQGHYRRNEEVDGRYEHDEERLTGDQVESVGKGFSWGVNYRWKDIELDGSVHTTLDLFDLFTVLDARLYF